MLRSALRMRRVLPSVQTQTLRFATTVTPVPEVKTQGHAAPRRTKRGSKSDLKTYTIPANRTLNWNKHPATYALHTASISAKTTDDTALILEDLEAFFALLKTPGEYITVFEHTVSSIHILLSRLIAISMKKDDGGLTAVFSTNYFMNVMFDNGAAFPTIVSRAVKFLISQKRYEDAFNTAERGLKIIEENPRLMEEETMDSLTFKDIDIAHRLHYFSYLATCQLKGTEPTKEKLDTLPGAISEIPFGIIVSGSKVPADMMTDINKLDIKAKLLTRDPNSPALWQPILRAASKNRSNLVDDLIADIRAVSASRDIPLNEYAYSTLMEAYSRDGRYNSSLEVFKEMVQNKTQMTVKTWRELLYAHSRIISKDISVRMESVEALMNQLNVKLDTSCYNSLIYGYVVADEITKADTLIAKLQFEKDPSIDLSSITTTFIYHLIKRGQLKLGLEMTEKYEADGLFKRDIRYYNALISHYMNTKRVDVACEIVDGLMSESSTVKPDAATFTNIINLLLKTSKKSGYVPISELKWILSLMKERSLIPNQITLSAIMDNAFKDKKLADFARTIFDFMRSKHMPMSHKIYTIVINGEVNAGNIEGAITNYGLALNDGSHIDQQLYNIIFKGFYSIPDVEPFVVESFYKHIKLSQAKPNLYTFYFLLKYVESHNDMELAQTLIYEIEESDLKTLGRESPSILKKLIAEGNLEATPRVLELISKKDKDVSEDN